MYYGLCKLVKEQTKRYSKKITSVVDKFFNNKNRLSVNLRHKPYPPVSFDKKDCASIYNQTLKKFDYDIVINDTNAITYKKYVTPSSP